MRLFEKTKDGGPDSPVDAYFLIESKKVFSIALLRFNKGARETFHNHAFNALTWYICGDLEEVKKSGDRYKYRWSILPKFTSRDNAHRVISNSTGWCLTIRGPWTKTWNEFHGDFKVTLGSGRKVVRVQNEV